ncbi:SH3 domain-containing protein [Methylocystis echinoides]|uniref:SH3b domain-containing protein n=1 Tax=Methylocystis echinoides TaxID=29468 RepID=A0A9W6GVN6_9HYPH|nr:SH3 domain-containing protein [Methylocystis echinoides]GLI93783.1 hypothetical protein LMG27198_27750 [Methylocystis echinoides]
MQRFPRMGGALLFLAFSIGVANAGHRSPDFADGLSGGPDYWAVAGVGAGDTLSLRKSAGPRAGKIAELPNGTVLRNLGCRLASGGRWCRVETTGASVRRGWVNGRYLRETGGPR